MQAPRSPGAGGETRSYYFLKAAAEQTELTLISLGGVDGSGRTETHLASICETVIEPNLSGVRATETHAKSSRWSKWLATLSVLMTPWKNHWGDFLTYFVQFGLPGNDTQSQSMGQRLLTGWLKTIYRIAAHTSAMPPMTTFMFYRSFEECRQRLRDEFGDRSFDAIWCEHSTMYPLVRRLQRTINAPAVICNSHNIETQLQERFAGLAQPGWAQKYWRLQATIFRRLEKQCYSNSRLTFTCSEEDSRLGESIAPGGHYSVVGNGVNGDYFRSTPTETSESAPVLVFTGGFGYEPNRDAVTFFVKVILPVIWKQIPDCKFLFAGFEAERMWNDLQTDDERIQYECSPADIRPCFQRATVFVVPLRVGGGTRLKVLEAMAMERAIVSTTLGAEGIPCESGTHLALADSPQQFATEVVRLLEDQTARKQLGSVAGKWVREHFDWKSLSEKISTELAPLL